MPPRRKIEGSSEEQDTSDIEMKPERSDTDRAADSGTDASDSEDEQTRVKAESGRPSKRRKLAKQTNGSQRDDTGDGSSAQSSDSEVKDEEEEEVKPFKMPQRIRDRDGFQEGAVVRVKCHNFLTYTDTEVFPGPYLNMIIGPNGTGKSTICSAISIALGTKAKTLKRHDKVSAMVKYGAKEAFVEVELKGKPGQLNTIIRREFSSENNTSVWKLNKRITTEEKVTKAVAELNIQTDNRVCYLPQELVYEFAKLSGPELLRATESSAGHRNLPKWHDQLVELKRSWMVNVQGIKEDREQLEREEVIQQRSRREEERFRERERVQQELELLGTLLPYKRYHDRKIEYDQLKAQERQAKQTIKDLKKSLEPFQQGQTAQKEKRDELVAAAKAAKSDWNSLEAERRRTSDAIRAAENRSLDLRKKVENLTSSEKQRLSNIVQSQSTIRDLEAKVANGPPADVDTTEERNGLAQLSSRKSVLREEYAKFQETQNSYKTQRDEAGTERDRCQEYLQELNNTTRQREEKLRKDDPKLYEAFDWIRQNRAQFRGKVYDPVCLSMTPAEPDYARFLDGVIRDTVAKTILIEDGEDYEMLSRRFNNKVSEGGRDLRLNLAQVDETTPQLRDFRNPWSPAQLKSYGFDMWALDMARGPEEILRFLCRSANLHTIPISLDDSRVVDEGRIQKPTSDVRRYVAQGTNTVFNFSSYGRREVFANSNKLKHPNSPYIIFSSGVDEEAIRRATSEVEHWTRAIAEMVGKLQATIPEEERFRQRQNDLDAEKKLLLEARQRKESAMAAYSRQVTTLESARANLRRLKDQPSKESERKSLMGHLKTQAVKRSSLVKELEEILSKQFDIRTYLTSTEVAVIHAQTSCDALDEEQTELNAVLRDATKRSLKAVDAARVAYNAASEALEEYRATLANYTGSFEQDRVRFDEEHPGITLLELEELKENKEAELSAAPEISPEVVRQIRARDKKIQELKAALAKKELMNSEQEKKIRRVENKYKPIIKSVVAEINDKFASAFASMGCLGEVQLNDTPVDPSEWAIRILVSFRKGTEMVELSGQRQSGGERSLATIMYFISLTKVSTAPFSLVDEINQGMDARNERAILDLLVQCTCEEDASQYFLITPKLLPHLRYHEKMKVLCINNGDWLPEEGFSPRNWLNNVRKKNEKPLARSRHDL